MAATLNMLKPKDEAEAAQMIADARANGLRLEIQGNGSKREVGNKVDAGRIISTANISGIVQYDASELVMVAKAGTPLKEIDKALANNKQMHVFEPANWGIFLGSKGEQTIGGVAATNMSGPRRYVAGAARDSLLGVRFINGQGQAIKNGGQVMKNVTGLDLVKLMGGSWGTLGMMTEVSFKVLPRPESEITLAVQNQSDADGAAIMAAAMTTSTEVSGAAHAPPDIAARIADAPVKGGVTYLRLEGLKETIPVRREKLVEALGKGLLIEEMDARASRALWRTVRDVLPFADSGKTPVWRISVSPMVGHKVVAQVLDNANGRAFYDWQGGLVWLNLDDDQEAHSALVRETVRSHGNGHATLVRATESVKAGVSVFHPESVAVAALSERIKNAMDPDGIFNIGRMVPAFGEVHA